MPEIGDACGNVRVVEVFFKCEAKHFSKANRHIRITAEIKENLQGISQGTNPKQENGLLPLRGKSILSNESQVVGKDDLFGKSDDKALYAIGKLFFCDNTMVNLFGNRVVADNGSCNQLRKKETYSARENRFLCAPLLPR